MDVITFGLVVIEPVLIPAVGHRDLLAMFQDDLDTTSELLAHLDR